MGTAVGFGLKDLTHVEATRDGEVLTIALQSAHGGTTHALSVTSAVRLAQAIDRALYGPAGPKPVVEPVSPPAGPPFVIQDPPTSPGRGVPDDPH